MPELPEVETIVRDLKEIEGQKVIFFKPLEFIDSIRRTELYKVDGFIIEKIHRLGKYIIIKFEKSALLIHLGMSGQLYLDYGNILIPKHCHWVLQLDSGFQLRYVDTRRQGNLWHMSYNDCINYVYSKIGPEPWDIDSHSFYLRLKQNKYLDKPIKVVLMDQKVVCGLGNIYVCEALWDACIHPKTLVKSLSEKHCEYLLASIRRVLKKGIQNRGTTISDYKTGKGEKGNNQNSLKVYKCHAKNCQRCKDVRVSKETIDGRSTYFCNKCQILYKGVKK